MRHEPLTSRLRRIGGGRRRARGRAGFQAGLLPLEERALMSRDLLVPIPSTNVPVALSAIFWNGGPPINTTDGKSGVLSPADSGAMKTITLTNFSGQMLYPFLRSANNGRDPNDPAYKDGKAFYDPQDWHNVEFRQYIGYTAANGKQYLGLPPGATINFQVPLVLWDGDNLSLVTDGTYLTTPAGAPGGTVFNYDVTADINVATEGEQESGTTWVLGGAHYPKGATPLVMFYYDPAQALTVPNDAPAQLVEVTYRDPYLKAFINDSFQTFALLNYDVSYVNTLVAPASMEASNVPITAGAIASNDLRYFTPNADFGWHGSAQGTTSFDPLVKDFVGNVKGSKAYLGKYFGARGWPQYYTPNSSQYIIPSGANIFDDSPLNVNAGQGPVHTSHYDGNRWLLSSSGGGAIQAGANGTPGTANGAGETPIALNFGSQADRALFASDVASMEKSGQTINVTISGASAPYQGVLGTFQKYDPSGSVRSYTVDSPGSGYSSETYVKIVGGGGTGAKGQANIVDGTVASIGILPEWGGTGYTSPPEVEIIDPTGKGHGAKATASITGGTAYVTLADGRSLPPGGSSYVFGRTATDYASTAITDLWYSWAKFYTDFYAAYYAGRGPIQALGSNVLLPIGNSKPVLTNQIQLQALPAVPLVVGMQVNGPNLPDSGVTIVKIVGTTIYLSQIPSAQSAPDQPYTFTAPVALAIDPISAQYTKTYPLVFPTDQMPGALLFAGSVYEAMQVQTVALPPSAYLPTTMNVVDHVIKFYANIPTYKADWGPNLVANVRDVVKSILRGVYDYTQVPDQSQWYPDPALATGGQDFNVYNLDPYVWFVHKVEGLTGYGFSVDDDVANPSATGPRGDDTNHAPSQLQIGFGGIRGSGETEDSTPLTNDKEWFPTTKWGFLTTEGTISTDAAGRSVLTLDGSDPLRTLNQIVLPGPGQVGAYVLAPGYVVPGTTAIQFPNGPFNPQILLSQPALPTTTPISVTIDAAQMKIPTAALGNSSFTTPLQETAPYFTVDPKGEGVAWSFAGTAGIAGPGSTYTSHNPAPVGTQVGFVEGDASLSQSVVLQADKAYAVSFLVAQQDHGGGVIDSQSLRVTVGDQVVGDFTPSPVAGGTYTLFTSAAFKVPTAGSYKLTIAGTNPKGGDNTALIDLVKVTGGILVQSRA